MSGGGKLSAQPTGAQAQQSALQQLLKAQAASGSSSGGSSSAAPAFLPGFDTKLAEQLSAGYGTPQSDVLSYLNTVHQPQKASSAGGGGTNSGGGLEALMKLMQGQSATTGATSNAAADAIAKQLQPALGFTPQIMFKGDKPYYQPWGSSGWVPATLEQAMMRR